MSVTAARRVGILAESAEAGAVLRHARETLESFGVPFVEQLVAERCGLREMLVATDVAVWIVGDASADPLSAAVAGLTIKPVLAVPVESPGLPALEALRATTRAGGPPVGSLAVGKAGAINAALLAVAILANADAALGEKLARFRAEQTAKVLGDVLE